MRKIIVIILCLLLCAGLAGGAFALYNHFNPDDKPTDNPIENPDENGGNTDNEEIKLTVPPNVDTVQNSKMQLKSIPELRFNKEGEDNVEPAMRFTCYVDKALGDELKTSENKKFGFIIAPVEYFDRVNTENVTCIDWMTAFNDTGLTVITTEYDAVETLVEYDANNYVLKYSIGNIKDKNVSIRFVGIAFMVDKSGEAPVYTYCEMPDGETYRTIARSVIQLSGEALNANAIGERSYTVEEIGKMKNYINIAVDMANGLSEPTEDGSMPTVTFTNGNELSIAVGKKQQIKFTLTPEHERLVLPARYVSMNEDVAVVNSNGVVTGLSAGSATVKVYIAGELYTVKITVEN